MAARRLALAERAAHVAGLAERLDDGQRTLARAGVRASVREPWRLSPLHRPEFPRRQQATLASGEQNALNGLLNGCNRALTSADFRAELPGVRAPSLVRHGTREVSAPIDITGRPTAAMIPGAELGVYQDAPHGLFLTHAERFNADVVRATLSLVALTMTVDGAGRQPLRDERGSS